ncbi:unnamed protein product [Effrenium voratum]|nr:unnamed protein product [Effrenium voratum]|mmetsp:Transcript_76009/g.181832  ORF Transcript_76009/g.181832 Transcript_76009/m.181832 type:complete len:125 (+) Transcript_76009:183-557(+)
MKLWRACRSCAIDAWLCAMFEVAQAVYKVRRCRTQPRHLAARSAPRVAFAFGSRSCTSIAVTWAIPLLHCKMRVDRVKGLVSLGGFVSKSPLGIAKGFPTLQFQRTLTHIATLQLKYQKLRFGS